ALGVWSAGRKARQEGQQSAQLTEEPSSRATEKESSSEQTRSGSRVPPAANRAGGGKVAASRRLSALVPPERREQLPQVCLPAPDQRAREPWCLLAEKMVRRRDVSVACQCEQQQWLTVF